MTETDQRKAPLLEALKKFNDRRPVYFCIPGHRFGKGLPAVLEKACNYDIAAFDLTEAPGLDDLHNPEGAILRSQQLLAHLFEADESRFLVNGTTCGIEAAIMACAGPGEEILMPRNVHRSAIGGLIMSGADPVWMEPEFDEYFGFASEIFPDNIRKKLDGNRNIKAVLITSPTYYGRLSDIKSIASICHDRGVPLIVDEAHGAHLYFSGRIVAGALRQGADISVMSAHKTLNSFGQSSFMHIVKGLVSVEKVDAALKILMSSSPSYMLMASLDAARFDAAAHGYDTFAAAKKIAFAVRKCAAEYGLEVYGGHEEFVFDYSKYDPARVVISASSMNMSGIMLRDILFHRYGVAVEMADRQNIVLVVTSANTEEDVSILDFALGDISRKFEKGKSVPSLEGRRFMHIPRMRMTPRTAFFSPHKTVDISRACGHTAGESIVVYPPGNALVYAGEVLDGMVLDSINTCVTSGLTVQTESGHDISDIVIVAD